MSLHSSLRFELPKGLGYLHWPARHHGVQYLVGVLLEDRSLSLLFNPLTSLLRPLGEHLHCVIHSRLVSIITIADIAQQALSRISQGSSKLFPSFSPGPNQFFSCRGGSCLEGSGTFSNYTSCETKTLCQHSWEAQGKISKRRSFLCSTLHTRKRLGRYALSQHLRVS